MIVPELDLVINTLIVLIFILFIPLILVVMYRLIRGDNADAERIRKEYEARLKAKDERIHELENYVELLKKKHNEELQMYMRASRSAVELYNAVTNGAVKLRCPEHPDANVQILADGTILCSKGHRLWPKEG